MAFEEPPHLSVGTEVSAKYRGAFCEATVNKVDKVIKCRVILKETGGRLMVMDDAIKGTLKVGATVEVAVPNVAEPVPAILQKITDNSLYTVVFDDGDESTLRRSQLCPKGEKHFVKSDTLDELPLTNPEHFGTPVMKNTKAYKRKRSGSGSGSEEDSSDEDEPSQVTYPCELQSLLGRVILMPLEERGRRFPVTVPALVVQPAADGVQLLGDSDLLVKSFKDSKFSIVSSKVSQPFTRELAVKNEDKATKAAFEKALLYYDTRVLPQGWLRDELLGSDSDADDVSESSDSEPNEERDMFVAQLYKFMDDRGTPINKAPVVGGQDLNLYRLFRLVHNLGGYNRVTNQMKWRLVYSKMHLPVSSAAANQIKSAYKKFLHAFEDFYRKLGSSMGTISRPGARGRHPSGSSAGRSILSFRDREGGPRSPRSSARRSTTSDDRPVGDVPEEVKVDEPVAIEETEKPETRLDSRVKSRLSGLNSPPSAAAATIVTATTITTTETDTALDVPPESPRSKPVKKAVVDSPKRRVPPREGRKTRPETRGKKEEKVEEACEEIVTRAKAEVVKVEEVEVKTERRSVRGRDEDSSDTESKDEEPRRAKSRRVKKVVAEDDAEKEVKKAPPLRKRASSELPSDASSAETSCKSAESDEKRDAKEERDRRFDNDINVGSKLRVKYGRGRDQKIYEAKVVERAKENGVQHYRVHYDGWNKRYDEWVRRERIVSIVAEPKPTSKTKTPVAKAVLSRKKSSPLAPVSHVETPTTTKTRNTTAASRPTRSNSVEQSLSTGLPARLPRTRRSSGIMEAADIQSHGSESEDAASSSEDVEEEAPSEDAVQETSDVTAAPDKLVIDEALPSVTSATPATIATSIASAEDDTDGESSVESIVEPRVLRSHDDTKSATVSVKTPEDGGKGTNKEETLKESECKPLATEELLVFKTDEVAEEPECSDEEKSVEVNVTDTDEQTLETPSSEQEELVVDEPVATLHKDEDVKVEPVEAEEKAAERDVQGEENEESKEEAGAVAVKEESQVPEAESSKIIDVVVDQELSEESKLPAVADVCKEEEKEVEEEPVLEEIEAEVDEKPNEIEVPGDQPAEAPVVTETEEMPNDKKEEEEEETEETEKRVKVKTRRKEGKGARQRQPVEVDEVKAEVQADVDDTSSLDSAETVKPKPRKRARLAADNSDDVADKTTTKAKVKGKTKVGRKKKVLAAENEDATITTTETVVKNEDKPIEASNLQHFVESIFHEKPIDAPADDGKMADQPAPYDNTPPDTPDRPSPGLQDEAFCTPSEHEANQEVAALMADGTAEGSESPMACDVSTCGSSGNAPSSECEEPLAGLRANAGTAQTVTEGAEKKRKRGHKRVGGEKKQRQSKHDATDSDEADVKSEVTPSTQTSSPSSPGDKVIPAAASSEVAQGGRTPRPSKYNFIESLEEGKYLEGESRIEFLVSKIQEMRNVYMQLKAEVACIDRRRKRHHRRERNNAASAVTQQTNSPAAGSDAL